MSEIFLLDSNTIMYLMNGDTELNKVTNGRTLAMSFVNEIELFGWPQIIIGNKKIIQSFFDECYFYDYSADIKNRTIELRMKYRLKLGDAFIAATALEYDLTLLSADKSFLKVEGLNLVNFTPSI